jgi:hypothetical protein
MAHLMFLSECRRDFFSSTPYMYTVLVHRMSVLYSICSKHSFSFLAFFLFFFFGNTSDSFASFIESNGTPLCISYEHIVAFFSISM